MKTKIEFQHNSKKYEALVQINYRDYQDDMNQRIVTNVAIEGVIDNSLNLIDPDMAMQNRIRDLAVEKCFEVI